MPRKIGKMAGRTRTRLLKLWSGVLLLTLGLLAPLAGCKPEDPNPIGIPEYGVFPAKYLVMPDFDAND